MEKKEIPFEKSLAAVEENKAIDPCSSQWLLIWMYGAYLDENFTPEQRKSIEVFYKTMPDLCTNAKQCFRKFVDTVPPQAENRRTLMGWIQMAENSCRTQNGLKPKPFRYVECYVRSKAEDWTTNGSLKKSDGKMPSIELSILELGSS
ncbi:conserved hypothetical protein [Theileria equi strain WA]|uniref:thiol oxidase n=1 Tax=Theileria equi strain WA TaxID=1537102 RepID=L1LAQ0_THEEQ|nr:conserved hypothetical protein [Theileria equi strain WA]EKX72324.1 conserved hypothetical protein [Theileria equi strain WA]|eukprot:XP_004831776.1 conserved hypothetical protein [Theileria equi strain WA]